MAAEAEREALGSLGIARQHAVQQHAACRLQVVEVARRRRREVAAAIEAARAFATGPQT